MNLMRNTIFVCALALGHAATAQARTELPEGATIEYVLQEISRGMNKSLPANMSRIVRIDGTFVFERTLAMGATLLGAPKDFHVNTVWLSRIPVFKRNMANSLCSHSTHAMLLREGATIQFQVTGEDGHYLFTVDVTQDDCA